MILRFEIDTENGVNDYEKGVLMALAGQPMRVLQVGDVSETIYGAEAPEGAAGNDGLKESTAELEEHDADEPPVAEQAQVDDGRPRHPDGRIVGQAPEGKKRRTKAQIAEDEAWEAAQKAAQEQSAPQAQPEAPAAQEAPPQGGVATPDNTAVPQQQQAGFGFGFGQQQPAPQAPPQPQGGSPFPGF